MRQLLKCASRIALIVAASSVASASDWYVDAVNGSNANSGASASSAWKTITFALANAPSGAQTIHVLPGLYDATNGETFPLSPQPDFVVVGDGGTAQTIVDAGATTGGVFLYAALVGGAADVGPATRLEGFTLRGSDSGVRIEAKTATLSPTLAGLDVSQTVTGVLVIAGTAGGGSIGSALLTLERVRAHGCTRGLGGQQTGNGVFTLTARDCEFSDNTSFGVYVVNQTNMTLHFERCRLDHNLQHGIYSEFAGFLSQALTATFEDCSVSANTRDGWSSDPSVSGNYTRFLTFTRCTIAKNGWAGIQLYDDCWDQTDYATLDHCIVARNGTDIDVFGCEVPTIIRSCIEDGSYVNGLGSFSGDPKFRSPVLNDFRLRWTSPCIDAATSAPPPGTLDLDRHTRDVDGDLNTVEVSDLGAFEFRPLELVGTGALGTVLQWELWGGPASAATVYWTRVPLPGSPTSTPYGDLDLDPVLASVFRVTAGGVLTPVVFQRSIPNAPFLVGHTFAFQSLTDCAAAPSGMAYTNAVQITIVP